MSNTYNHLTTGDRNSIQKYLNEGLSIRKIADILVRSPSTISREIRRTATKPIPKSQADCAMAGRNYDAVVGAQVYIQRRRRGPLKLAEGTELRSKVIGQLKEGWSPEQIAGKMKVEASSDKSILRVCHETIYTAIYATPKGELRKSLIGTLRRGRKQRMPRSRGKDRRGALQNMTSIHDRPDEVKDRVMPGHWEGDLIKGEFNRSAVGTLVERTSRAVILVKMEGADAESALEGFSLAFSQVPKQLKKTLTYDQGKEMANHLEFTEKSGMKVYFADPHSPWQRPSNENTNGLIRQYLPKGTDLSGYTQRELNVIAARLNNRPRQVLGFQTPNEVLAKLLADPPPIVAVQT